MEGKVFFFFFSLRRLFALSARLDVGRWSRALSLIGSPEQTHQLTSSPSGRDADASSSPSGSRRSVDIIWLCWFFSGYKQQTSLAPPVQVRIKHPSILLCFFFFCISIIIRCLKVCFSRWQVFPRSSFFISCDISLVLANMAAQSVTNGFRDTRTTVLCPLGLLEGRSKS